MRGSLDFEALYRLYYQPLYRYALLLCGSSAEAEDGVQNAFVRALRAEDGFRGDSSVKTWLYTITRNECLRLIGKRQYTAEQTEDPACTVYIEQTVCDREAAREVMRFIEALEEPKRSLLALRLVGEKSFAEIGEVLGKSETWCRVTFMRQKNELLKRLEGFI